MTGELVLRWLLDGDPAIRWQAMRDIGASAERTVRREQRRVASEGWGARLLELQDPDAVAARLPGIAGHRLLAGWRNS